MIVGGAGFARTALSRPDAGRILSPPSIRHAPMDALTRVLDLARMQGVPDLRCQLGGAYRIDHDDMPTGIAPFHLVLSGAVAMERSEERRVGKAWKCRWSADP